MTTGITITPAEVREGDKIAVTLHTTAYEDRENVTTYTGVAHKVEGKDGISGKPVWRTEKGWNLYVHEEGAVIELLDRPEPALPSLPNAVVKYMVDFDPSKPERFAVRAQSGLWRAYDTHGVEHDLHYSNSDFAGWMTRSGITPEVVFGGVAE